MKKLLVLIFLLAGCSKTYEKKISSLIFLNGDSNSCGIGNNVSAKPSEYGLQPNVQILNPNSLLFGTLNIGVNNNLGGGVTDSLKTHGIELGLANNVDSGFLPTPTFIAKCGHSGYKIKDLLGKHWPVLTARLDAAINISAVYGITPELYMFYSEGINDANFYVDVNEWKADTKTYFQNIRSRYGRVPIFMTYVPTTGGYNPKGIIQYNQAIKDMQKEIPDFYAIETSGAPISGVHWGYAGLKVIANRFVDSLITHYKY